MNEEETNRIEQEILNILDDTRLTQEGKAKWLYRLILNEKIAYANTILKELK